MYHSNINNTSKFLKQQIFDIDDLPVHTIRFGIKSRKRKATYFNPTIPQTRTSKLNEKHLEFEPEFMIRKGRCNPKIAKENNLIFVSVVENGKVISKKINLSSEIKEKKFTRKYLPEYTELIVDLNNKRARLIGFKTSPEWVEIDVKKIPAIPNN